MDENRPKSGQPISLTGGAVKPLRATSVLARIQISTRDTIRTFHVNIMIAMNRIIVTVVFNPRRTGREKPQPVLCAFLFTHALPYKRYGFIHARARTFIFLTTNFFFYRQRRQREIIADACDYETPKRCVLYTLRIQVFRSYIFYAPSARCLFIIHKKQKKSLPT